MDASPATVAEVDAPSSFIAPVTDNFLARSIRSTYTGFQEKRAALDLPHPGSVEQVAREVQRNVFLKNMMFSGLRAALTSSFSAAPLFQTAHNFTMGSNQEMSPYDFAVIYGTPKVFMQGNMDTEFQSQVHFNYRISKGLISKMQLQLAPGSASQSMAQFEADYTGRDFHLNLKAMNPSIIDGPLTGIFVGSYMQSVTKQLALGLETMYQRPSGADAPAAIMSYAARYKTPDWIASLQLMAQGGLNASYWRKVADRVEGGVDINLQFLGLSGASGNPMLNGLGGNEGQATIGMKYDFRTATFRGQVDSKGKVSCFLDKRMNPTLGIIFAGELDHSKNTAKIGFALTLDTAPEELILQQERGENMDMEPPPF